MFLVACTKDIDREHLTHKGAVSNHSDNLEKNAQSCDLEPNLSNFEKLLTNPQFNYGDECTREFLTEYIKEHNQELKNVKSLKQLSNKANKSLELILTGCSENNLNNCQYFYKLKNIYGMREYLLKHALLNEKSNIFKYYYYLNAAYDSSNSRFDEDIYIMYLKHHDKYAKIIQGNSSLEDIHHLYMSQIIESSEKLIKNPTFKNFITTYTFPIDAPLSKVDVSILKILTDLKGTAIFEEKLKSYINEDLNVLKKLDNFKADDIDYFSKTLKIAPIPQDIYYYVISSAYHNKKNHDSLKTTLKYYNLQPEELTKRADTFIKLHFLKTLRLSHKNIVNYFHERKYTPNTFFANAIARSEEAYPYFQELFQKTEYLNSFLRTILLSGDQKSQEAYQKLGRNLFKVLDNNIKYMVTFPQMMMLLFEFAKKGLELNFRTFWGGFYRIPSDQIIKNFFEGEYKAFFKYSSDYNEILDEEIPYTFYYALNTGLFKDFSDKNGEHQLVIDFLKIVADQLSLKSTNRLSQDYDLLLVNHKTSSIYKNFLNLCNEKVGYIHQLPLADLDQTVFLGQEVGGHIASTKSIFSAAFERNFERIRTVIKPINDKISILVSMYEDYLRKLDTDEAKIQAIMSKLNKSLAPINHLKTSYLTQYWNRFQEYDKCYYAMAKKEKVLQLDIIEYEEKYLRDLYRKYHERDAQLDPNTLIKGESNFSNLNKFKEGKYYYTKIDFLMRVRAYLEKGWKLSEVVLPALSPSIKILTPQDEYSWNRHENFRESESRYQHIIDIKNQSEDEFVHAAIMKIAIDHNRNPYGFTRWFQAGEYRTFSINTFTSMSLQLGSLYKMGEFKIYTDEKCSLQPTSKNCEVVSKKLTTDDLIKIGVLAKDFLHIHGRELETLKKVGSKTRLPRFNRDMFYLLMNPLTKKPENWGIYDYVYYIIKSPLLADFANFPWTIVDEMVTKILDSRKGNLQKAEDYYIARHNRGNLIFNMNENLEKSISERYKQQAWSEIDRIKDFEQALESSEEAQNLIGPIRYEVDQVVHKELLDQNLVDEADSVINTFHLKTNNFYKR